MSATPAIYLDACCFVEVAKADASMALEGGRDNEVWFIKKLLQAHRDREITVYTSALSIAEAVHVGSSPVPPAIQRTFEALLTSGQYVYLVQTTPFICIDARNLRWMDGINLRGADSVHLASALDRHCSEFLTMDKRFERLRAYEGKLAQRGMVAKLPSGTSVLPGRYLQGDLIDQQHMH